jgi:hypothetical protein
MKKSNHERQNAATIKVISCCCFLNAVSEVEQFDGGKKLT